MQDGELEQNKLFEIEIFEPEGGAKLGKANRADVTITNDDSKV